MPEKCIYWPSSKCLFISDVHLGKVAHFRTNGIAIPAHVSSDNYHRLEHIFHLYKPDQVLFLGDIFHSTLNKDWYRFKSFAKSFLNISFELVKGNHDILGNGLFDEVFDKIYEEEHKYGPFLLTHDIRPNKTHYNLCGHIHPSVRLKGKGLQSLKLPCFYFTQDYGILPAFGSFTGTHCLTPKTSDRVFVIADDEVLSFN